MNAVFIVATEDPYLGSNGFPLRIQLDGLDVTSYWATSRRVGYNHRHVGGQATAPFPVAECMALWREGDRLLGMVEFDCPYLTARSREIWAQVTRNRVGASPSVLLQTYHTQPDGVTVVTQSQLLEWSLVDVPRNPACRRVA